MTTTQPRKTLTVPMIIFIVVGLMLCYMLFNSKKGGDGGSTNVVKSHYASYYVGGWAGTADITYENSTGGTEQNTVTIPWTSPSWEVHDGDFLYISAQNNDELGSVTCEIRIDGIMVKQSKSEGAYVIATCSGRY
jgi:hypothetical protein